MLQHGQFIEAGGTIREIPLLVDSAGRVLCRIDSFLGAVFPEDRYDEFGGVAGTNDNDIVYTSPDISGRGKTIIECTVGAVDIEVSLDGTNFNTTPPAVLLHDATAPGTLVVSIPAGKIGILNFKCRKLRIRQNGATASNCRGVHVA